MKPILTGLAISVFFGGSSHAAPLKVFILAGQSNMEGHAKIETFDYIGDDPATAPLLKMMRGDDGQPRVCDHTWISYLTGRYDGSANGEGTVIGGTHYVSFYSGKAPDTGVFVSVAPAPVK